MAAASSNADGKEGQKDNLMFEMYVAHELAMGGLLSDDSVPPEEELSSSTDPLYAAVKRSIHDAFWNIFREEVSRDPPQLSMAFHLIKDIKESLLSVMTPNSTSVRNEVEEVLDVELMEQQLSHDAFDVSKYGSFILSVMSRVCAPIRDGQLAQLKEETDIVKLFRGILETLDLMKLDLIKFALTSIKPEILNNKMEYERKKFNDLVKVENGLLPNTELWLSSNMTDNVDPDDVVLDGFVDLLKWQPDKPYPETLFMDAPRLIMLKRDYYKLVVACSSVLLTFSVSPPEIVTNPSYKEALKQHAVVLLNGVNNDDTLRKILPNLVDQLKSDANSQLAALNLPPLADPSSFAEQISQVADPANRVRSLVGTRIQNYLRSSAKTPRESVFPAALVLFKNDIDNLNSRFRYIANFNLNICGDYYRTTIDKLRSTNQQPSA